MKDKFLSLVVTALIFISINGMFLSKEVEKDAVENTQETVNAVLRLPFQH